MNKDKEKAIPDKEVKPETIDTDNKTESTTSTGEYSESKKVAMGIMKSYFGEEEKITDDNYGYKLEEMVAKDYYPTKEKNTAYETANRKILAMMDSEPELSGILSDMSSGAKFTEVLPKYIDLTALIDSKGGNEEAWEANNQARMDRFSKIEQHRKMMAENEERSLKVVEQFKQEKKLEGEDADNFAKWVAQMIDRANSGDITMEFLNAMYNAMNYEKDVMEAKKLGEVAAKNTKIEEKMKSAEDLKKGDGLPSIASADEKVASSESNDFADRLDNILNRRRSVV